MEKGPDKDIKPQHRFEDLTKSSKRSAIDGIRRDIGFWAFLIIVSSIYYSAYSTGEKRADRACDLIRNAKFTPEDIGFFFNRMGIDHWEELTPDKIWEELFCLSREDLGRLAQSGNPIASMAIVRGGMFEAALKAKLMNGRDGSNFESLYAKEKDWIFKPLNLTEEQLKTNIKNIPFPEKLRHPKNAKQP